MKRPLLLLIILGYIAVAVYSLGKTGINRKATRQTSIEATQVTLNRLTVTATNMPAMVRFYNEVFDAKLEPVLQSASSKLAFQQGRIAGINILLCPSQVTRVKTIRNWHQLRFIVPNLETAIEAVQAAGGKTDGNINEQQGNKLITVRDPDGNIIELIEASK